MTIRRFFADYNLANEYSVTLTDDEHNHLKNVLKLKVGDEIVVVCGDEYDYNCVISDISKNKTTAKILNKTLNEFNPKSSVTVFQALTKRDAMSNLTSRLTELGITNFVPISTTNTVAKNTFGKVEKLQVVSNQSVKQCKRSIPVQVHEVITFNQMLPKLAEYDIVIFANETENNGENNINNINFNNFNNVAIIVGSEGGFTPKEIEQLIEIKNVKSISLGKRILRVETATIALTALVLNKLNELN